MSRFAGRRAVSLAVFSLFVAACDDGSSLSNVFPEIVVDPDSGATITFDPVVLTRTEGAPQTILVSNKGIGILNLELPKLEGTGAGAFDVVSYPRTLPPGGNSRIVVTFNPNAPKVFEAKLSIGTNDPSRQIVSWDLTATAREPCVLFADQSAMNFAIGDQKIVNLISLSSHECKIDRISLDRRVFAIVDEPEYPITIPAGASLPITLQHFPVSSSQRGVPVRIMTAYEAEGGDVSVRLEGEAPLFGCLSAQPSEIVFPDTELGQTRRSRVTVTNSCGKTANIVSAVMNRGYMSYHIDDLSPPKAVPPRGSVDVWVTYAPMDDSDTDGLLVINTNDAAAPRFLTALSGPVSLPHMTHFPLSLDFGTVIFRDTAMTMRSECSSATRTVKIYSDGSAPLQISRLEIAQPSDGYFEVTGVTIDAIPVRDFASTFTIPVSSSAEVSLQFYPTRLAPEGHTSRLLIHSNASTMPGEVLLAGHAKLDGPGHDSFTQLAGPKADILWVIDNSCSMFDEQARLIDNMSRFVAFADAQNSDYQMAVTITDSRSGEAGKFEHCYPHPRIVKNDYPRREEAFRCLFDVGTNGPFLEAGLGAAYQALQRAQAGDSIQLNGNTGFLRDDANLAIVILSDEEDQSLETEDLLRDYFWSIKGRTRVKVHAIAGPVAQACRTDPNIQPGTRYFSMTQETGGLFFSICEEDWAPVLQGLGLNVFTPISEWQLTQAAVPASVGVTVDGVPIVWSTSNGFVYDTSSNTVRFFGAAVPEPGAQIEVDYLGNCRP